MANHLWYVKSNGKEIGPISSASLKRMAAQDEIRKSDNVRRCDWSQWIAAVKIKGLFLTTDSPAGGSAAAAPSSASRPPSREVRNGAIHESTEAFYRRAGKQVGPLKFSVLKQLVTAGLLKSGDEVRIDRDGDWIEAVQVPGLMPPEMAANEPRSATSSLAASVPPPPPLPPTDGYAIQSRAEAAPSRENPTTLPLRPPIRRGSSPEATVTAATERRKRQLPSRSHKDNLNESQATSAGESDTGNTSPPSQVDNRGPRLDGVMALLIKIAGIIVGFLFVKIVAVLFGKFVLGMPYRVWQSVSPGSYKEFTQPLLAIIIVSVVGFTVVHFAIRWIKTLSRPQTDTDDLGPLHDHFKT